MGDPIKSLTENLNKNGVPIKEDALRGIMRDANAASQFYHKNESELGVDKDYWMSHVNQVSNFDVDYVNAKRDFDNKKIDLNKIQDRLRKDFENGITSPNSLFAEAEKYEFDLNESKKKLDQLRITKEANKNFSKDYTRLLTGNTKGQAQIIESGLAKKVLQANGDTKQVVDNEKDQLQPFLRDDHKELYAVQYQLDDVNDNIGRLKNLLDNSDDEKEKMMAQDAYNNALKKKDELLSFYVDKKNELDSEADTELKKLKKEKQFILSTLLPPGVHDQETIDNIIKNTPEVRAKIKDLDRRIQYADAKKSDVLKNPDQAQGELGKKQLIDKIDLLLPGVSDDPQTKITAYALAKKMFLDKLIEKKNSTKMKGIGVGEYTPDFEGDKQIEELKSELQELAPIALLNRTDSKAVFELANTTLKSMLKYAGDYYGKSILRGMVDPGDTDVMGIDLKTKSLKAEIVKRELDEVGLFDDVTPDVSEIMFGSDKKLYDAIIENKWLEERFKKKNTLNEGSWTEGVGDNVGQWKDEGAKELFAANLKMIDQYKGELFDEGSSTTMEMLGGSLAIMADLAISEALIGTGAGVGLGAVKAAMTAKKLERLYGLYNKSNVVKSFSRAMQSGNLLKKAKATKLVAPRGAKMLGEAFADGIKWHVAGNVIDKDQYEELTFGAGFLSQLATSTMEGITGKFIPKAVWGMVGNKTKQRVVAYGKRVTGTIASEYIQENAEDFAKLIESSSGKDIFRGAIDILSEGLSSDGGETWNKFSKGFSEQFNWGHQTELLKAVSGLSIVMGAGLKDALFAKYNELGGDAKMLEDMKHYMSGVKSVRYGGVFYEYDGQNWLDGSRNPVDDKTKAKLNSISPSAKAGDTQDLWKAAKFQNGKWVDENGDNITGTDLIELTQGLKNNEKSHPYVEFVEDKEITAQAEKAENFATKKDGVGETPSIDNQLDQETETLTQELQTLKSEQTEEVNPRVKEIQDRLIEIENEKNQKQSQGADEQSGGVGPVDASTILAQEELRAKVNNGDSKIEAAPGVTMYSSNGGETFTIEKTEGSTQVRFTRPASLRKASGGEYFIEQTSPVTGSMVITKASSFKLARAIKNGNTLQKRSLKMIRNLMPLIGKLKKVVNGIEQELSVIVHDGDSYNQINPGNRGHYDPNTHTVHINLGATIGNTSTHEILHPFFNAIFEQYPELKNKFFGDLVQIYKEMGQDEGIVEYAADQLVYAITPMLDKSPGVFARVIQLFRDILRDLGFFNPEIIIGPHTDLSKLIGELAEVAVPSKLNIIEKGKAALKKAMSKKVVDPGFGGGWTGRTMQLLRISEVDENGKRLSPDKLSELIQERYEYLIEYKDDPITSDDVQGDPNLSEFNDSPSLLLLAEANTNLQEWQDFLRDANYPIAFKAGVLAEIINYNFGPNGYTDRGKADVNKLDIVALEKAFKAKAAGGVLKEMYSIAQAEGSKAEQITDEKTFADVNADARSIPKPELSLPFIEDQGVLKNIIGTRKVKDRTGRSITMDISVASKQAEFKKKAVILQKLIDCI